MEQPSFMVPTPTLSFCINATPAIHISAATAAKHHSRSPPTAQVISAKGEFYSPYLRLGCHIIASNAGRLATSTAQSLAAS